MMKSYLNIFLPQIFKCFDIIIDILLPFRHAGLDRIMNVDALYACDMQSGRLHFIFHAADSLPVPYFTGLCII